MQKLISSILFLIVFHALNTPLHAADQETLVRPQGGDFSLKFYPSQHTKLSDLKGNVVFIFFGYTRCPNVCPLTVERLKKLQNYLGAKNQSNARFLFISVDNKRDTPKGLRSYAQKNGKLFLSATANDKKLRQIMSLYGGYFSNIKNDNGGTIIDHSDYVYVISPKGKWVDSLKYDRPYEDFLTSYTKATNETGPRLVEESKELPKRNMNFLGANTKCDLSVESCSLSLPDGSPVTLTFSPRPIKTEKEFAIDVKSTSQNFIPKLVDFVGIDQNMGLIRPNLEMTTKDNFTTKLDLPLCELRKMQWRARVVLADTKKELHFLEFFFHTIE